MDINILKTLMKLNGINSYLQLSKVISIPYTTLLDLINGKGERLSNIKIIANYFNVSLALLTNEVTKEYIVINEDNSIEFLPQTFYNSYPTILMQA